MVKESPDRMTTLGLVALGNVTAGGVMIFFLPLPSLESWPYVILSALIHCFYHFMLFHSYRLGALSQVYPVARGSVPILVAIGGFWFAGEILSLQSWVALVMISSAIFLLVIFGYRSSHHKTEKSFAPLLLALMTGLTIASYSIIDGLGARLSGNALSYVAWLLLLEFWTVFAVFWRRRKDIRLVPKSLWLLGITGGLVSSLAYILVIYAKTLAPLGIVSALRETSVIFATLIGVIYLKERPWKHRIVASVIACGGIFLLAIPF